MKKHYLELVYHRSLAGMKNDAAEFNLGVLWWILDPALYLVIFYVLFERILHRGGPNFVPFLLCGLLFWRWFASSVLQSANCIKSSRSIIGLVYLPKILLPCSIILTNTLQFLIVLVFFLIFLLLYGYPLEATWLYLPLIMQIQLLLVVGVSFLLAAVVPFVPDLSKVISYGMTFLFFMSGIFFDVNEVPAEARYYLSFNPMVTVVDAYRDVLLRAEVPRWRDFGYVVGLAVAFLSAGAWMLWRFDRHYPRLVGS